MADLPTGTVTFLFTDVEGSARLWERYPRAMREALLRHDAIIEAETERHHGEIVRPRGEGDSRFAVFPRATDAVAAAAAIQVALHAEAWPVEITIRVRLALHTGEADRRDGDYYGSAVNRCARLRAIAHGGQTLVSEATCNLVRGAMPPGASLQDLGNHRLRDLALPERVYQLHCPGLPADFPPLRSLDSRPNNLPTQATPFIGRERQLEMLRARLVRPDVRLLTLTGPGGAGKTRLALQAAADLLDSFDDGAFFVSLAPLSDATLAHSTVARALGVDEVPGHLLIDSLKDYLKDKQLLLVLDNFEHLVDAAPMVAELLAGSGRLKVLTTSRVPLRLYGENSLLVPPMELPDQRVAPTPRNLSQCESVKLFVERSTAAKPDFTLTDQNAPALAEICHRLDGLPLAIELAAARVHALSPRAMLDRMVRRLPLLTGGPRDVPARQQTLRRTIAWSYDLLDADEQILFRRLAVFRGCTLEAAEAVCSAPAAQPGSTSIAIGPLDIDVLDGVVSLVEKSLLRQEEIPDGQPRYVMLETVREYALERLAESDEADAIQRRHVLHYLKLAEAADQEVASPHEEMWLARIEQEHDNFRAALDCCVARGYVDPGSRLALALWWYWTVHGRVSEGRQHFAALLARFPLREPTGPRAAQRANALRAAGMLAASQGDFAAARALQEDGLAVLRALGDLGGVYAAVALLAIVANSQGDYLTAHGYAREYLEIARALEDKLMIANAQHTYAYVLHEQGDYAAAREMAEESLTFSRESEEPLFIAAASLTLGIIARDQGDYDTAQNHMDATLAIYRETGGRRNVGLALANLGSVASARGDFVTARERLGESLAIYQEMGDTAGIAFVLEWLAMQAAVQRQSARALSLAGTAAALRETVGAPLSPGSRAKLDEKLAAARKALGEAAAAAAWAEGRGQSIAEAVAFALAPADGAPSAPVDARLSRETRDAASSSVLSIREFEVVALIARGCTNREIAAKLVITEGTAANHVAHIFNKLGFSSRSQIAVWAVENRALVDRLT